MSDFSATDEQTISTDMVYYLPTIMSFPSTRSASTSSLETLSAVSTMQRLTAAAKLRDCTFLFGVLQQQVLTTLSSSSS